MNFANNRALSHAWASQQHDEGKTNGGNFYFEGPMIYSYGPHFPIAKFTSGVVLFTTEGHSNTTARHISLARQAVSHERCIDVDNIEATTTKEHRVNIQGMIRDMTSQARKWKTSRRYKDSVRSRLYSDCRDLMKYLNAFGLKPLKATKKLLDQFVDVTNLNLDNENQFVLYLLDLGAEETKRLAAKAKRNRAKQQKLDQQRREREQIARQAAIEKAEKEYLPLWRANGGSFPLHVLPPMLRVKVQDSLAGKSAVVQTSHGAEITQDEFCVAYRLWKAGKLKSGSMVGDFKYRGDNEESNCVDIGCHCVPVTEIEDIAEKLGLLEVAVS